MLVLRTLLQDVVGPEGYLRRHGLLPAYHLVNNELTFSNFSISHTEIPSFSRKYSLSLNSFLNFGWRCYASIKGRAEFYLRSFDALERSFRDGVGLLLQLKTSLKQLLGLLATVTWYKELQFIWHILAFWKFNEPSCPLVGDLICLS